MTMRQALNIKCWQCGEVFTMSAKLSQKPDSRVEAAAPCPFCQAVNQVIVRAEQVQATVSYKDGQSLEAVSLEKPGALLSYIFGGTPLSPEGLMHYYPPRPTPDPPPPKPTPPDRPTSPDKSIPSNEEHSK